MRYSKQVSFGKDENGKRRRKRFYADKKEDLERQIRAWKNDLERLSNPSDVTFREYSLHWFDTYKSGRSRKTQEMYSSALAKCSDLYACELRRVSRSMCQSVVNRFWNHPRAAEIVASVLRQIFRSAADDGIILSSPARKLDLPKKDPPKFRLITEPELKAIKAAALSDQDRLFVTILQVFGLRPGEALALQPRDFDFASGVLHVTKALEMPSDGASRIKDTKTGVCRDIPIPASLVPYFRKAISGSSFLLFPKSDGAYYSKSAYRCLSVRIHDAINQVFIDDKLKALKKKDPAQEALIRATDYVPDLVLYSFRHRRATDLYYLTQKGVISTKQAAALMGHSEFIFLKTYSHIDNSKENLSDIYEGLDLAL